MQASNGSLHCDCSFYNFSFLMSSLTDLEKWFTKYQSKKNCFKLLPWKWISKNVLDLSDRVQFEYPNILIFGWVRDVRIYSMHFRIFECELVNYIDDDDVVSRHTLPVFTGLWRCPIVSWDIAGAVSIFGPDALPVVHQWLLLGLEPATSRVRVAAHNH